MYSESLITVDIVVYNGFKMLEAVEALSVFNYTNAHLQKRGLASGYDVRIAAQQVGPVVSETGVALPACKKLSPLNIPHTAIIVGAWEIEAALQTSQEIVHWFRSAFARLSRTIALCSGAFFLADAGLLDGIKATTHWAVAEQLQRRYPTIRVDADSIYVREDSIWTSAGVTAGLDLALAVVEEDFGAEIALEVARDLVVYLRRQGGQSQFSSHLLNSASQHPTIRDIQNWVMENCCRDIGPADFAHRASMSVRSFNRYFKRETGTTPSTFLTRARVEIARSQLEEGGLPAKTVAARSGFGNYEAMRRAFQVTLGVTPLEYRDRFGKKASGLLTDQQQ